MTNYYRITGYDPNNDYCFIIDCNGMFEKKWQFSSMLIQKGLKVLEITDSDTFIDVNITPTEYDNEHIFLRANDKGKPQNITQTTDGITYKAIKVADKIYIPDRTQTV